MCWRILAGAVTAATARRLGGDVRSGQAFIAAMRACERAAGRRYSRAWALSAVVGWDEVNGANFGYYHPCGRLFCARACCEELPTWLRCPTDALEMGERLVAVLPHYPTPRRIQAVALSELGEPEAACRAYLLAAQRCGGDDGRLREQCIENARAAFASAATAGGHQFRAGPAR